MFKYLLYKHQIVLLKSYTQWKRFQIHHSR